MTAAASSAVVVAEKPFTRPAIDMLLMTPHGLAREEQAFVLLCSVARGPVPLVLSTSRETLFTPVQGGVR